jgi:TPP-dependent pyruvate/acetoin dehydrogenase alpha subunit
MRMHGHGAHDDMSYVPKELFKEWELRDPIATYTARLIADHGFTGEEIDAMRAAVKTEVDEGARRALEQPMPDPAEACDGVFADRWEPLGDGSAPWSYWSAQ